jgi:hypothetical protein
MKDRVYTAEMGSPPQDIDGGSAAPKRGTPKESMMMRRDGRNAAKANMQKKATPKGDGMFREGMPVPQDIDGGSAKPFKKGGSVSARADGVAKRGRTNCKMV